MRIRYNLKNNFNKPNRYLSCKAILKLNFNSIVGLSKNIEENNFYMKDLAFKNINKFANL